jgi:sec-independent protein translocase protein TatA
VLAVVLLLFGRGKIPELMGDVAKGIKNFKNGIIEDDPKGAVDRTAEISSSKTDDRAAGGAGS